MLTGDSAGGFFTLVTWYRLRDFFKQISIQPSLLSFIYPAFGYRFDSPSYQKNKNAPILPLKDVLFFYLSHGNFERSDKNYNLLENQLHFDWQKLGFFYEFTIVSRIMLIKNFGPDSLCKSLLKLSDEFKKRTDPWRWLTPEQIGDAVRPNEASFRKTFSKEESSFRDG